MTVMQKTKKITMGCMSDKGEGDLWVQGYEKEIHTHHHSPVDETVVHGPNEPVGLELQLLDSLDIPCLIHLLSQQLSVQVAFQRVFDVEPELVAEKPRDNEVVVDNKDEGQDDRKEVVI
jgi:hypothetical protein